MKTRIAHFADTHLGYRQYSLSERERDFYQRFEDIIDDMIEKEVDCVIHSGDLFESPKPPINALLTAQKGFMKLLSNNIPIYVIAGNHDKLQRTGTEIPQRLFENENFHILEKGKTYEINEDIFIGGLQYIQPQYQNSISEFIEEIKEKAEGYKYKILVLHGGIKEKYDDYDNELELNTISEGFDYYAMGHIHKRIKGSFKEGILSYPGSTELRTKKEWADYKEQSKGYNIVTFDDGEKNIDVEYVNIPLKREMVIEDIEYPQLEEELVKIKEKIENHTEKPLVNLTVKNGDFVKSDVVETIYEIIGNYCLSIRVTAIPHEEEEPTPDSNQSTEETLHEYIKETMDENIAKYSVSMYKELKIPNIEEAITLSEDFYEKIKEGTIDIDAEINNDRQEDEKQ